MSQKFLLAFLTLFSVPTFAGEIYHQLIINLEPQRHTLQVSDTLTINSDQCQKGILKFSLHAGLNPEVITPGVGLEKTGGYLAGVNIENYQMRFPPTICSIQLKYQGAIHHPPVSEYSPGTIDPEGVFLGGSTYWYPIVTDQLVQFQAQVSVKAPWSVVSQGELVSSSKKGGRNHHLWKELKPQDDIYLVAAHFKYYSKQGAQYKAEAYLRTEDQELADRYLDATINYLELYDEMIGPYPYSKFSLIENFWETGYGMPSFTLLGSNIVRLPFILYTSYPHEILHNWWGNGVFVDYKGGNWSEGLTSYLADHYFKELQGKGYEYRRDALQNFSSYVNEENDFPLNEFISRTDKASSAIGYGKVLMFFHMLKLYVGEAAFFKSLRHFYSENLFQRSSYADLQNFFELNSEISLKGIFSQWTERKGSAKIQVASAKVKADNGGWELILQLEQIQVGDSYHLRIPYQLNFSDTEVQSGFLTMTEKTQTWSINLAEKPVQLVVDPNFDVFRYLYREEIPPNLSETYGESSKLTVVLPSRSSQLDRYRVFAEELKKHFSFDVEILEDKNLEKFPQTGSVWILGWQSKFSHQLICLFEQKGASFSNGKIVLLDKEYIKEEHSVVVSLSEATTDQGSCVEGGPHPSLVWTGFSERIDPQVLSNKIFHYGSYSYIGFDQLLKNNLKGQWVVRNSPLHIDL